ASLDSLSRTRQPAADEREMMSPAVPSTGTTGKTARFLKIARRLIRIDCSGRHAIHQARRIVGRPRPAAPLRGKAMHMWKKCGLALVLAAGLTPTVTAQIPLTPPSAGGATPLAAPPAAQPTTLWDFLGVSKIQREACKEYVCKTQFGQLLNNGLA